MPQAIPFIVAAAKAVAIKLAIAIATHVVVGAVSRALAGDPPQPEQAKIPIKQPIPPAQVAFGEGRISGAFLYYASKSKYTLDVIALCDGPVDSFIGFYLNDDYILITDAGGPLTVRATGTDKGIVSGGTDGRYGSVVSAWPITVTPTVEIYWQVGDFPATAFARVIALSGGDWTSFHRADGIATVAMACKGVKAEDIQKIYPNTEPLLSAVGRWSKCYDWRLDTTAGGDGLQRRNDPDTWTWTNNAAVCFVHDEWYNRGQDWDFRFAPALAYATAAANICDEEIPLKAGGTEPRYSIFGYYQKNNPPKALRELFLQSFDALLIERGDGAFVLRAGKYEAPTVTLTEDQIITCGWRRTRRREDTANKLVLTYNSPAHGYTMVEADPWYDLEALESGEVENPAAFERSWVTSNGQIRRLAKRGLSRLKSRYQGHLVVRLSDDETELEQRYFRVKNRRAPPSMWDVVVEVVGITLDLQRRRVRFDIVKADPDVDEWDPETEEGNPPDAPPAITPTFVPVPEIVLVDVFLDDIGSGFMAPRLTISLEDPERDDLSFVVAFRVQGDEAWVESAPQPGVLTEDSPPVMNVDSGFVPSVEFLEIRVAAVAASGRGQWSDIETINTLITVGAPDSLTAEEAASYPGVIVVSWRNPPTPFDYVRIFQNTFDDFGSANQVDVDQVGGLAQLMSVEDFPPGSGTFYYWAQAYDATGGSAVAGPVTVTI